MKKQLGIMGLITSVAVAVILFMGAGSMGVMSSVFRETSGGAYDNSLQDSLNAKQNQSTSDLAKNQPAPIIKYSDERQNLIQRYETYSNPKKLSYIAEVTQTGGILYTGTVKGKITALSSQLSPEDRMQCTQNGGNNTTMSACVTVKMPEPDGSWSTNGSGVFWYDSRGVYHEWNGLYTMSDAPFVLTTPPVLTINADAQTPNK